MADGSVGLTPVNLSKGRAAPRGGLRASDADRAAAADWVCWATGTGQLSLEEADDRLARAYAARTLDELAPLTADLQPRPRTEQPAPRPSAPAAWLRERGAARLRPYLVPVAVASYIALLVLVSRGTGWFPWPLLLVGLFVAKAHHHRHGIDQPRRHHHRDHHHHHRHRTHDSEASRVGG